MAAKLTELGVADDTKLVSAAQAVLAPLNNTGGPGCRPGRAGSASTSAQRSGRGPCLSW